MFSRLSSWLIIVVNTTLYNHFAMIILIGKKKKWGGKKNMEIDESKNGYNNISPRGNEKIY